MLHRAIVFDLDETLIDRYQAVTAFAATLWRDFFSQQSATPDTFLETVHRLDGHGYTPRPDFFESMAQEFNETIPSGKEIEERFYAEVWETPRLAEGVVDTLAQLHHEDIPLAIVTNGSIRAQSAKINASGLIEYFDVVVVSEAFGVKKPEPSIYLEAVKLLDVDPGDAWFVGDHPVNDIWGSKQVGFNTAWIHLNRPWPADVDKCADLEAEDFRGVMDQVMEGLR